MLFINYLVPGMLLESTQGQGSYIRITSFSAQDKTNKISVKIPKSLSFLSFITREH